MYSRLDTLLQNNQAIPCRVAKEVGVGDARAGGRDSERVKGDVGDAARRMIDSVYLDGQGPGWMLIWVEGSRTWDPQSAT